MFMTERPTVSFNHARKAWSNPVRRVNKLQTCKTVYTVFSVIRVTNMTNPNLREPTKKAFHFPKSAEAHEEKPVEKPVAKSGKRGAATTRVKTKPKAKPEATEAKAKPSAPEAKAKPETTEVVAAEPALNGKSARAKKENPKKASAKKEKVVRDSFTMPKTDYEKIAILKKKCLDAGVAVKKSELLRAGLQLLESTSEKRLLAAIAAVETVKTGRPSKAV